MTDVRAVFRLTLGGIRRNSAAYMPYLLASSLCVCVFYIFASIQQNEIMNTLPHASYVMALMIIGEVLLGIILIPFLISINRFLIKQRKTELGLYSVLGLEKKHIAVMLFSESVILFVLSAAIGIGIATIFSKLVFLFLLNITHLPVDSKFTFSPVALTVTLIFFGSIALFNLFANLFRVSLANPSELFRGSKQGEKEPKHLWLTTILGVLILGGGFTIALNSKMNSMVFTDFFFAVLLVIIGTNLLFKSVSITFLKACQKNKNYYYKSKNFVTVSGMLYRMKKNASGLANICIFCTMTIITLIFTTSVYFGEDKAIAFDYPYDCTYAFGESKFASQSEINGILSEAEKQYGVTVDNITEYSFRKFYTNVSGNEWSSEDDGDGYYNYIVNAMTLKDYNRTQGKNEVLAPDEVLMFNATEDYTADTISLDGRVFRVRNLSDISFFGKNKRNLSSENITVIFDSADTINSLSQFELETQDEHGFFYCSFDVDGEFSDEFTADVSEKFSAIEGYHSMDLKSDWEKESYALIGGLLFLGVFFGIVFIICMLLIMYYKQVTEGYEDKKNFEILRKVGMTDKEVRSTISRQILTVFFMPLITSIIYTAVALNIVCNLLSTIRIFDIGLIFLCAGLTSLAFAAVYTISYVITAGAYYKIVR